MPLSKSTVPNTFCNRELTNTSGSYNVYVFASGLINYILMIFLAYFSIWHIWQSFGEHISLCQSCLFIRLSHLFQKNKRNQGRDTKRHNNTDRTTTFLATAEENLCACSVSCVVSFVLLVIFFSPHHSFSRLSVFLLLFCSSALYSIHCSVVIRDCCV